MSGKKRVLMLAMHNQAEALRMAAGLTLLDDSVSVLAVGALSDRPDIAEQMEVLTFADVPVAAHDNLTQAAIGDIARAMIDADAVFVV